MMQRRPNSPVLTVAIVGILFGFSNSAYALITGGSGNKPVRDNGWPTGALDIANDFSRVAWWEGPPFGGGEHHFEYCGDASDFNRALSAFAELKSPKLELVIHDGVHQSFWLRTHGLDPKVDWTFTVWKPSSWHRLYNNPRTHFSSDQPNFRQRVAPPRIDVYIGGSVDWEDVKVPKGIHVSDQRASALGIMQDGGVLLRGVVYDMASGKVISGARVVVEKTHGREKSEVTVETTTGDGGEFLIEKIPAEMQRVYVAAEGYAPRVIAHERFQDNTFRTFNVELIEAAEMSGAVVDSRGKPLEGIKVRLTNPLAIDGRGYKTLGQTETTTDEGGNFKLTSVPTGYAQIRCIGSDYYHNYLKDIYDVPSDGVTLKVTRTGTVNVNAVDKEGKPITSGFIVGIEPEGGVRIGSWSGSANVNAEGSFTFKGVPPGRYRIYGQPNPRSGKYKPDEKWVDVVGGKTIEVQVVRK